MFHGNISFSHVFTQAVYQTGSASGWLSGCGGALRVAPGEAAHQPLRAEWRWRETAWPQGHVGSHLLTADRLKSTGYRAVQKNKLPL